MLPLVIESVLYSPINRINDSCFNKVAINRLLSTNTTHFNLQIKLNANYRQNGYTGQYRHKLQENTALIRGILYTLSINFKWHLVYYDLVCWCGARGGLQFLNKMGLFIVLKPPEFLVTKKK